VRRVGAINDASEATSEPNWLNPNYPTTRLMDANNWGVTTYDIRSELAHCLLKIKGFNPEPHHDNSFVAEQQKGFFILWLKF
jgi:hypothetical protein